MQVEKGSINVSVELYIIDSTDGTPELGVLFNTAGIDLNYHRDGAVVTSITEIDLTTPALTDVHEDGGFLEVANGRYRLDVPDAAFATGVDQVTIGGTVTGMIVLPLTITLTDPIPLPIPAMNLGDFALTETVTAPFPIYYKGIGVTISAFAVTDIEVYKDGSATQRTSDAGFAVAVDFDGGVGVHSFSIDLTDDTDAGFYADGSQYWVVLRTITAAGQELVVVFYFTIGRMAKKLWNPAWDAEVQSEVADGLAAYNAMATTDLPVNFSSLNISSIGSICVHFGTADAGAATTIDLETGVASTVDDYYNDMMIVLTGGIGKGQKRLITDYEGSTNQRVTVDSTWVVTPDATTTYEIHRIIFDPILSSLIKLINQGIQS